MVEGFSVALRAVGVVVVLVSVGICLLAWCVVLGRDIWGGMPVVAVLLLLRVVGRVRWGGLLVIAWSVGPLVLLSFLEVLLRWLSLWAAGWMHCRC